MSERVIRLVSEGVVYLIHQARGNAISLTLPRAIEYSSDEELKMKYERAGSIPASVAYQFHTIMRRLKMTGLVEVYEKRHEVVYILTREKWSTLWGLVKSGERERAIEYMEDLLRRLIT